MNVVSGLPSPHIKQVFSARRPVVYRVYATKLVTIAQTDQLAAKGGVHQMAAKKDESVSWGMFQWVVTGLLGALAVMVGIFLHGLRQDVSDLRTATVTNQLEIVRGVAAVEKQLAITNTKLDGVLVELRQRPR